MHYQPQISTINAGPPPSYSEAINQQPPLKNNFPLPPFDQHGSYPPQPEIRQYPTSSNYQVYNVPPQPPYNPAYTSMETNPQQACVVTTAVVRDKNRNVACSSCVKMVILSIAIVCVSISLLKVIIANMK